MLAPRRRCLAGMESRQAYYILHISCTNSQISKGIDHRRVKMYSVVAFIVNVLRLNLVFSKWILHFRHNGW